MSEPVKILLVDDNTDTIHQLAIVFRDVTDEVVAAVPTLAEAREVLYRDLPPKLFVDLQLPDGDGIQFIEKARAVNPVSLIVAATAYGDDKTRRLTLAAGANVYLVKPVTIESVMKAMEMEYPPKATGP